MGLLPAPRLASKVRKTLRRFRLTDAPRIGPRGAHRILVSIAAAGGCRCARGCVVHTARHLPLQPDRTRCQGRALHGNEEELLELLHRLELAGSLGLPAAAADPDHQQRVLPASAWRTRFPRLGHVGRGFRRGVGSGRPEVQLPQRPGQQGPLHHQRALAVLAAPQLLWRDPHVGGHLRLVLDLLLGLGLVGLAFAGFQRILIAPGLRRADAGEGWRREVGLRTRLPPLHAEHLLRGAVVSGASASRSPDSSSGSHGGGGVGARAQGGAGGLRGGWRASAAQTA
mmetsp:Transcript_96761/g.269015  ORF Transcript_96761/g.269015 Transcript_96761/m.269015 type:complete len:284 (-) Transcript_96761:18-869(-)